MTNQLMTLDEIIQKLPAPLRIGAEAFNTEFERELFVYSGLTVSSALFTRARGRYFSREIFPNLFLLTVSAAASNKGSMLYAKKLTQKIHEFVYNESKEKLRIYNSALKEYNTSKSQSSKVLLLERPPFKIVHLPGNVTISRLLEHIAANEQAKCPSLILESEIDSLTTNGLSDWPAIDEMLRKSYHNEPISYSRKTNNEYLEINQPMISVALSGTKDQLFKLIRSAQNGTYSRFMVLKNNEEPKWFDVRPCDSGKTLSATFEELSNKFFEIWKFSEKTPFEFLLHDSQWDVLNNYCSEKLAEVLKTHGDEALSIVKRHGVHLYKLALTLTCFRRYEWEDTDDKTYCLDTDIDISLALVDLSLKNSLEVYSMLPDSNPIHKYSYKQELFEKLPDSFDRQEALKIGEQLNISQRTLDRCLKEFSVQGKLNSPMIGVYNKS